MDAQPEPGGPSQGSKREEALRRFEAAVELPLLVLALAMVPLLVVPLLVDLPPAVDATFVAADWFIWAAFAFEYVVRLVLTTNRGRFVRREWADLLIVVLPFLRPLRVVRSAKALRILRLARLVSVLGKVGQSGRRLLVRHQLHYAILVTGIVVLAAAALMLVVEDGAGGTIDSFGDALWWAVATVTTVGYGDTFPVTAAGRGIAAFLMVSGITLFGVLTANIATFLIEREPEQEASPENSDERAVSAKLDELLDRVRNLEALLIQDPGGSR
jgi:voltage-gated potassium channel